MKEHSLRTIPWIQARTLDGTAVDLGLDDLYARAHKLRGLRGEAVRRAGTLRVLMGLTALVLRQDTDIDRIAESGFDPKAVRRVLGDIDQHLWLVHPDTPFLQDATLIKTASKQEVQWMTLARPGASSKGWFHQNTPAAPMTPEEAAGYLCGAWFYSQGVAGRAYGVHAEYPSEKLRPRGTVGFRNHGLRSFWTGDTLAQTLLANVDPLWVTSGTPAWMLPRGAAPADPLALSTWSGSTYLLDDPVHGEFQTVNVSGRLVRGMTKAQYKELEHGIWEADTTVVRVRSKPKDKPVYTRPARRMPSGSPTLSLVSQMYTTVAGENLEPRAVGALEVRRSEVLSIGLGGDLYAPEYETFAFLAADDRVLAPATRRRLRILTNQVMLPLRAHLYAAFSVFADGMAEREKFAAARTDEAFTVLCAELELRVADIIEREEDTTPDDAKVFVRTAREAFERVLHRYITPSTMKRSAQAVAHFTVQSSKALRKEQAA